MTPRLTDNFTVTWADIADALRRGDAVLYGSLCRRLFGDGIVDFDGLSALPIIKPEPITNMDSRSLADQTITKKSSLSV